MVMLIDESFRWASELELVDAADALRDDARVNALQMEGFFFRDRSATGELLALLRAESVTFGTCTSAGSRVEVDVDRKKYWWIPDALLPCEVDRKPSARLPMKIKQKSVYHVCLPQSDLSPIEKFFRKWEQRAQEAGTRRLLFLCSKMD